MPLTEFEDPQSQKKQDSQEKDESGPLAWIKYVVILVPSIVIGSILSVFVIWFVILCESISKLFNICLSDSDWKEIGGRLEDDSGYVSKLKLFKLYEQLGEAIPQAAIAITFYVRHNDWILETDFQFVIFGVTITQTALSIFSSCVSILIGIFTTIKYVKPAISNIKEESKEPQITEAEQ